MQQTGQISPDGYWMWNGTAWVPNPYRQPAAPPPGAPYESARYRASVTSILLMVDVATGLLFASVLIVDDLNPSPADTAAALLALLTLFAVVVWLGAFITTIVFFCMWLHRVVRNMPALGSPDPRWSPARAVVYCFIPILNWFHPLWGVLDAWRGADPSRRWLDRASRRAIRPSSVFWGWWTAWIVGDYAYNISSRLNGGAGAIVFDVIGGAGTCIAAVFCIRVVRDVTARQERKNELISSGHLV